MQKNTPTSRTGGAEAESSTAAGPYTAENYTLNESIGYLLSRLRSLLTGNLDRALAEFDMTHAQFVIFRSLHDQQQPQSVGDLAREWNYDTGAMTRMLDRLEEKGFVARQRSQTDRRVLLVALSDKGRALADCMNQAAIETLNHHLRGFDAQEVAVLKNLLRRMIANA